MSWNEQAAHSHRSRRLGAALVLVALVITCGLVAANAGGTTPGRNGKIAYNSALEDGRQAIFVSKPDGSHERQLTHPGNELTIDEQPDWSPDGSKVVFRRTDSDACGNGSCANDQIMVVNADGTGEHAIAADAPGTSCAFNDEPGGGLCRFSPGWSPDGRRVVFACTTPFIPGFPVTGGLCVVNADGSGMRMLIRSPDHRYDDDAQYSPDGKRIVFKREIDADDGSVLQVAIFVMKANGTGIRRITPWPLRGGSGPDWSPDGQRILFSSNFDGPDTISANKYTVRPDGCGLTQITHSVDGDRNYQSGSYSPDGKWIVVTAHNRDTPHDLYVMRSDGSQLHRITNTPTNAEQGPDWGPAR